MSDWRSEIDQALTHFMTVAKLAGHPLSASELEREYLNAPHRAPTSLPVGKMAVYCFWGDGSWLRLAKSDRNPRHVTRVSITTQRVR
jgi:hypothetical protein